MVSTQLLATVQRIKAMRKLLLFLFISLTSLGQANNMYAENIKNEDSDLSFLPPKFDEEPAKTPDNTSNSEGNNSNDYQFTFDNTFQTNDNRSIWSNLMRLGFQSDIAVKENLSFKTNLLLNAYTRKDDSFSASDDFRLDVKEAYLSWQQSPHHFFDIGRINIKSGVATGFNPTDYFKVGALLDRNTEDISQLRDARIGSLALRAQSLWASGALTLVASPKISQQTKHWTNDKNIIGLNLQKSNDRSRFLLKLNQKMFNSIEPEFIYYNESGNHNLGLNLSQSINQQWITYAEWNIGNRRSLINEALHKPRESNQLATDIFTQFPNDSSKAYLQQLAIGASFTTNSNITTKLEYHYNQAGLSSSETDKWFDALESANPQAVRQALSVRALSQSRNEPLGQHSLFLRTSMNDALIDKLDFTGLLITDLNDYSQLIQVGAEYELNPQSLLSFRLTSFQGNTKSIYGSLSRDETVTAQFKYNF